MNKSKIASSALWQRLMKIPAALVILCSSIQLGGCLGASTYVSGIGERSLNGSINVSHVNGQQKIDVMDSAVYLPTEAAVNMATVPYRSNRPEESGVFVEQSVIDLDKVMWNASSTEGRIILTVQGKEREFLVSKSLALKESGGINIQIDSRYRRFYGYPAQMLQLVAVPADVVCTVIVVIAML